MDLQKLKAIRLEARKAKNKLGAGVLATLIGELEYEQEKGKVIDASVIVGKIKKYIATAYDNFNKRPVEVDYGVEAEFLESVLDKHAPKLLSGAEIKEIFAKEHCTSMKDCMLLLKTNYAGKFDGREASVTAKQFLGGL